MTHPTDRIIYIDNHLIAVTKPAGLLTQPDGNTDESLIDHTRQWIKEKYNKPNNVFLGLVHRLDRNVSGVVLFARTSKAASRLSKQFRERTLKKYFIYGKKLLGKFLLSGVFIKELSRSYLRLRQWIQSHSLKWYSLNFREKELTQ